jgi:hypothetical protein
VRGAGASSTFNACTSCDSGVFAETPKPGTSKARPRLASPSVLRALAVAVGISLLSLLLVAPAPSYDPWAWLLWGREVAGGGLSTLEGPAFKPLPVAVCALLAPLGAAAPWLWVLLVRVAAMVAALLAYRLARRLAGGSRVAGLLGAAAVLLCGGLPAYTAAGAEPALVLALALGAAAAWRERRMRIALACAVGCALLRVEAWPFAALAGVLLWRARPQDRALLAGLAVLVPAAYLVPELIGSGDLLRSGARARVPNPGQPALASVPGLAALKEAVALPLWPLWAGVGVLIVRWTRSARPGGAGGSRRPALSPDDEARARPGGAGGSGRPALSPDDAARARPGRAGGSGRPALSPDDAARRALLPAAAGAAWIALVALMAQAGFSGEPRYALPGAALIALSGAVGLSGATSVGSFRHRPHETTLVAIALVALAAAPRLADLPELRAEQAYQWRLSADLADAVEAAGGADAVLACGRPYVGRLRGPLMAYRIGVAKHRVEPDDPPRPPGMVFRSALHPEVAPAPSAPPQFTEVARAGAWQVLAACGGAPST